MADANTHVTLESGIKYTVDGYLATNLDRAIYAVQKDWDMFFIIDGLEGSGKSTLGQQCAGYVDRSFNISRIAFTPDEFITAVEKATKHQAVIFDEAMTGLHSRASMSAINRAIVRMVAEMRQKNLFVFVILPTFFDLDRYIALWRSRALLHTYADADFNRGRFAFFNVDRKKALYINGKKTYSYSKPRANFIARFSGAYAVNETEYRRKKLEALRSHGIEDSPQEARRDEHRALVGRLQALNMQHTDRIKLSGLPSSTYYLRLKEWKELDQIDKTPPDSSYNSKLQKSIYTLRSGEE